MRVAGHGLRYEGRTHNAYRGLGNGVGTGKCECGAESPDLPTTAARQRWHKEHKAEVLRERGAQA